MKLALLTTEPTDLFGFPHQLSAHERNIAAICFIAVMKEGEFCIKLQRLASPARNRISISTRERDVSVRRHETGGACPPAIAQTT